MALTCTTMVGLKGLTQQGWVNPNQISLKYTISTFFEGFVTDCVHSHGAHLAAWNKTIKGLPIL